MKERKKEKNNFFLLTRTNIHAVSLSEKFRQYLGKYDCPPLAEKRVNGRILLKMALSTFNWSDTINFHLSYFETRYPFNQNIYMEQGAT